MKLATKEVRQILSDFSTIKVLCYTVSYISPDTLVDNPVNHGSLATPPWLGS